MSTSGSCDVLRVVLRIDQLIKFPYLKFLIVLIQRSLCIDIYYIYVCQIVLLDTACDLVRLIL